MNNIQQENKVPENEPEPIFIFRIIITSNVYILFCKTIGTIESMISEFTHLQGGFILGILCINILVENGITDS